MTEAVLLPNGEQTFFDLNGNPLAGGLVYFYVPFTTTPSTTWQDQAMTTPNTNPVILDPLGRAVIWGQGTYRQVVSDSLGNLIWDQLTSNSGLAAIQSEVDTLNTTVASQAVQITALSNQVAPIQAYQLGMQVIAATQTFTIPATSVRVRGIGGGGGGGGGGTVMEATTGGNGAPGSWFEAVLTGLTIGNTLTVTIGAAGMAGTAPGGAGSAGGPTVVSSGTQSIVTRTAPGGGGGAGGATDDGMGGITGGFSTGDVADLLGEGSNGATNQPNFSQPSILHPFGSGDVGGGFGLNGGPGNAGIVVFDWFG